MKIFYFVKHHKFFVFALALSFCLTFIRPFFTSASTDYDNSIGSYISGQYVDYPIPNDDLLTISDLLISETNFPLNYQTFVNILDTYSLTSFFENWDPYNPSYYVDIFYNPEDGATRSFTICFYRSLFSLSSFSFTSSSSSLHLSGSSVFSTLNFCLPFPLTIPSSSSSDYSFPCVSSLLSSSINYASPYTSNFRTFNSLVVGSSYTQNFGSYVSAFLSSSDYDTCFITFYLSGSSVSKGFVGLGYSRPYYRYPLFNMQPFFEYSISVANSSFNQFSLGPVSGVSGVYPFISNPSYFSYSLLNNGLILSEKPFVTPSPIPSPEWVSPTPFPTVTLSPIDVTPIPQYLDPNVLGSDGNISDLNGFAGLLDQTFSNFDIFALGSSILEYVYSFSGYFSFILIIPVICLIAFALGRLNQK